jgi:regulator of nucleoside diphosphate kinase
MIAFRSSPSRDGAEWRALEQELERARIVASDAVPGNVVTMNSCAELIDLETDERMEFTLVFPDEANIDESKISVLAPVGLGMLGHRVGDVFRQWTPLGVRQLKITEVKFQPEAALLLTA